MARWLYAAGRGSADHRRRALAVWLLLLVIAVGLGIGLRGQLSFALTVGVLIDTFVVRLTLVPAAMLLFGRYTWHLPVPVDRILPNVDIEGASLPGRGDRAAPSMARLAPQAQR